MLAEIGGNSTLHHKVIAAKPQKKQYSAVLMRPPRWLNVTRCVPEHRTENDPVK